MRKLFVTALAALTLGAAGAALADDCHNVSRAAPSDPTQFQIVGNWAWIPEVNAWLFITPGTNLTQFGINQPDVNGNFKNGQCDRLLGSGATSNPDRVDPLVGGTGSHGILVFDPTCTSGP